MKTLPKFLIVCLASLALSGVTPQAGAAASSKSLLVSAVVSTACRLTQDHDHPSVASSVCTNGADFVGQALTAHVALIQKADSAAVVIF